MSQPSTSKSSEGTEDRYKKKWDTIFFKQTNDLYFDEELDYEYSDSEDIANSFPIGYTWSPDSSEHDSDSSESSSRPASPEPTVNLLHEEHDCTETRRSIRRLTKNCSRLCGIKNQNASLQLKKNWKKNANIRGILKRWRIRSLDGIFVKKHASQLPRHWLKPRDAPVDFLNDISIVVNNDLCGPPDLPIEPEFRFESEATELLSVDVPAQGYLSHEFATGLTDEQTLLISANVPAGIEDPIPSNSDDALWTSYPPEDDPNTFFAPLVCDTDSTTLMQPPNIEREFEQSIQHNHPLHGVLIVSSNPLPRTPPCYCSNSQNVGIHCLNQNYSLPQSPSLTPFIINRYPGTY